MELFPVMLNVILNISLIVTQKNLPDCKMPKLTALAMQRLLVSTNSLKAILQRVERKDKKRENLGWRQCS